jgi:hypothetical protein
MKKITLSIVVLSTLLIFACEEKVNTPPATTTSSTSTTSTTSSTGTTGSTYYINANYNGINKVFTNLTVYRDESTAIHYLLIVANNTDKENPKIEFNLREPTIGWSDNLSYALNSETTGSYVKYTNESGKVYSTVNNLATQNPLLIQFSKFQFVKDGIFTGNISGTLSIDTDTTTVRVTSGKINLKSDN